MISQNHSETPALNVDNPLFWKKKGQPSFIERHSVNLQKAQEAKDLFKKINRSYDLYQNSQSSYFMPQEYDPLDKSENYYLPKCLRDQFSKTQNAKEHAIDEYGNEIVPVLEHKSKYEKKVNMSIAGLNPEERKKLLSLDLSKLNSKNIQNNRSLNEQYTSNYDIQDQMTSNNEKQGIEICESPNTNNYHQKHRYEDSSSTRARESLFMLPRPSEMTKDQRKILLDDLETAYFRFKKDQEKQRFHSSNNRSRMNRLDEQSGHIRKSSNGIRLDPLPNQSMDLPSVINKAEAEDLLGDRTIDSNRIYNIMQQKDPKLKQRRKMSNEVKEENGIKYPLRLHMMNNYRKNRIDEIIKSKGNIDINLRHPADENYMDVIWKNMPEYQKVVDDERNKRSKEINSRKAQHTPIYDVLSLNHQQKMRVEKLFQGVIPLESRFYAIVQNKDEVHYKKKQSRDLPLINQNQKNQQNIYNKGKA